MAIDFTHRSRFNEEANFTMVRWGADSPVPEVELNEMQDISEGKLRDVVKATFGNGLLGVGTVEYDAENKTLKIINEKAFVEGYLLNIERLETRVTKDVPVRLNCWKEVITAESKIYKHGNMQAGFIPNTLIDERYGKEITRREQIVFNLESDDNPDTHKDKGYSLEIGSLRELINEETGEQYVGFNIVAEKASVDAASIGKTFCFSKDEPETDEEEYLWFKQLESDDGIPTENAKEFDMVLLKVNQKEGTTEVYYPKVKWSSIIDLPDNIVYSREVADAEIPSPVNINNSGLEIGMFTVTYGDNIPAGYIEANGQEINRIFYADLFDYAKSVGLVISEADWQAKFTAQSGLVTEYGYDDGSAMFRVPRIVGDSSLSEKRIIKAFGSLGDGVANYQDVIEAMKDYMPLAGGTMTGEIVKDFEGATIKSSNTTSEQAIWGGSDAYNGAGLFLYGGDKENNGGIENSHGTFLLRAGLNNSTYYDLFGQPDGSLKWGNQNIVRSINGVGADSAGNVEVSLGTSYVVESVVNEDGSWYRKYSDGWLEQGGFCKKSSFTSASYGYAATVTFAKPFVDANYTSISTTVISNAISVDIMTTTYNKTSTTMMITTFETASENKILGVDWYACGMGAE